jgi:uncharacterized protein YndB with AHSA1/START domain
VDRLVVTTDVYVPPEEVYEFLLDFPRYERYTEYLDRVTRTEGDGGAGSEYALHFSWWKLSYTARSRVTDVSPPTRIDWEILKDIDAGGSWVIEPYDELPEDAPADATVACRVRMDVSFDPDSASSDAVSLPLMVSFGWVLDRVKGLVEEEATRVVRRAVDDLEGDSRKITLHVETDSDAL